MKEYKRLKMKPKKYDFINKFFLNLQTTMEQGIPKRNGEADHYQTRVKTMNSQQQQQKPINITYHRAK